MQKIYKPFHWTIKRIILLVILLAITQTGLALGVNRLNQKAPHLPSINSTVEAMSNNCSETNAASLIKPNVVRIENKTNNGITYGSGFFEKNGYLVTNSHVVDTKGSITVYFANDKSTSAEIVSNDREKDIAILSVKVNSINALKWGDTTKLTIPQSLLSFGYALNLPGEVSVTQGIFSARRFYNDTSFIQTDTPINEGNSGGPLVDICGQVVGINTVATDNATINMAITSESAQSIIAKLILDKKVTYNDGSAPTTVLSRQFTAKSGELAIYVQNSDSKSISTENLSITPSSQTASTNSSSGQSSTSSSSNNSSGNNQSAQNSNSSSKNNSDNGNSLTCNEIIASESSVEIGQTVLLTFYYTGKEGTISWSGEGTFGPDTDSSPYVSKVLWSNNEAGNYELTVNVNTQGKDCKKTITITVVTPPPPVCSDITATDKNLEIDEQTLLNFSYSGSKGDITWSGEGIFSADENPSDYVSSVKWSNSKEGTYSLTAKVRNNYGECEKSISITVLPPPTRIEGLVYMKVGAQPLYNPQTGEQSIGVSYYFAGSSGNPIGTEANRANYLPVSIDITCRSNDKILFQHTYTWEEIRNKPGQYRYPPITIWEHEMNISSTDVVNPGPNGYIPITITMTGHTPEQGSFTYTNSLTFSKATSL